MFVFEYIGSNILIKEFDHMCLLYSCYFCVILHTLWSGKSIFPFGIMCVSTIRIIFVKILLAVCMLVGIVV